MASANASSPRVKAIVDACSAASTAAENSSVSASAAASASRARGSCPAGKLDRSPGQFDRPRSIADRGIRTGRQHPGRLRQHRDTVGLKLKRLVELGDGCLSLSAT